MLLQRFFIVGLTYTLIVYPSLQMSRSDTIMKLLDINKLSNLTEDVDHIVDTLSRLKDKCSQVEAKYKKLLFGLNKIEDTINNLGLYCENGVLYDKICLKYYDQNVAFLQAQQQCLKIGGTLFRPDFYNPNLIPEIKSLFPDINLDQIFIDVTFECTTYGSHFQYSNGLIIPDEFLIDQGRCAPTPVRMRLSNGTETQVIIRTIPCLSHTLALYFDSDGPTTLFRCYELDIQLPFICQCDSSYAVFAGEINLQPNEMELELIDLHNLHRNLKEQISSVEKQMEAVSTRVRAKTNVIFTRN